ncbi:sulfur-oxidizing protein SoxZ [Sulfurisoma sediminicola]|uniref:Sulfur-oxidizing protein SoxZ n=2 Tax=Sulfurisoma sediminicola TaxID=1381557 RepID=A0A497XAS2_9PROT|nr:sulfur-oxidizing protein SoxZ [Sulfurisoma sediminicola]
MGSPMKVRAQMKGDFADIKILMSHPMETGQRKDPKTNQTIPAVFIQQFTVEVGGKVVVQSETGTSISTNPVFGFKVKGAKAGDKVVVKWQDNKGDSRTDEATVA